jgi:hypothetical protein
MPAAQDSENKEHYVPDPAYAPTVWSMLRNDIAFDANGKAKTSAKGTTNTAAPGPSAAASGTIPVTVVNGTAGDSGTPVRGRASDITKALAGAGFSKAVTDKNAEPSGATTLSYPAASGDQGKADALAVAKALHIPENVLKKSAQVSAITLIVGADWRNGTDYSKTLPSAGSLPTSAQAINASDKSKCMDVYSPYVW